MRRHLAAWLALSCTAVAACGPQAPAASSPTHPSAASSTPASTPAPSTAAILDQVNGANLTLEIRTLSGGVVGSISLDMNVFQEFGAGPHHVWVVGNSGLEFYGKTGSLLATDQYTAASFSSPPVFTADGGEWAWAERTNWNPAPAPPSRTTIFIGTQARQLHQIVTHTETDTGFNLTPIAWAGGKVYLTERQTVGGGVASADVGRGAWVLDPASQTLTQLSSSCALGAVGPDGTLFCVEGPAVVAERSSSASVHFTVPGQSDASTYIGAVKVSANGGAIAVMQETPAPQSVCTWYTGSSTGGQMRHLADGCSGYWLPNGDFLVANVGGSIEVVPPSGSPTTVQLTVPAGSQPPTVIDVIADPRD